MDSKETDKNTFPIDVQKEKSPLTNAFLNDMLHKCEVKSYSELYHKVVEAKGGVVRCDRIFPNNPKYSPEKIKQDVQNIDSVLCIYLFQMPQKASSKIAFSKFPYLVTKKGLLKVIKKYKERGVLKGDFSLDRLVELFNVNDKEVGKFETYLSELIKEGLLYAEWRSLNISSSTKSDTKNHEEKVLHFYSFFENPKKKKLLWELIITVFLFIAILLSLFQFVHFM